MITIINQKTVPFETVLTILRNKWDIRLLPGFQIPISFLVSKSSRFLFDHLVEQKSDEMSTNKLFPTFFFLRQQFFEYQPHSV